MAVEAPSLGVLVEPAAQPGPFAEERLMRDLCRSVADRHQPALGQHFEHARRLLVVRDVDFVERHAPTRDRVALLKRGAEAGCGALRAAGLCSASAVPPLGDGEQLPDATASLIRREPHAAAVALFPRPRRAVERRGSAPGWPATSSTRRITRSRSTASPALRAGSAIARASSSRWWGATTTWLSPAPGRAVDARRRRRNSRRAPPARPRSGRPPAARLRRGRPCCADLHLK